MNNLRLKEINPQELKAVMETDAGKMESLYIWKQIQLIVSQLINAEILSGPNMVESIIEELKKPDRSGVDEVRQALDCPGLSLDQQTEGLRLTLEEAHSIVPEEEIYLRVNLDNPASLHVMLNNGGRIVSQDEAHYFVRIPNPGKGR